MVKRKEIRLIAFGIVASAYMAIIYDVVQELLKPSIDWYIVGGKLAAGSISVLVGLGILLFLTSKKRRKDFKK